MDRVTQFVERIAAHRRMIFVAAGIVFMAGGIGYDRVTFEPSVLTYFDPRSSELRDFHTLEDRFGRSNEIVFVIRSATGSVMSPATIEGIQDLRRRLAALDGVDRVRSILDLAPAGLGRAQDIAATLERSIDPADPAVRPFLSEDRSVTAVAAIIRRTVDDGARAQVLAAQGRAIAVAVRSSMPDVEILLTGRVMIQDAFQQEGRNELAGPAGLQLMLIPILLLFVFRSAAATAALMAVVFVSTVGTFGALGWLGIPLTGISNAAPAVLLALAVATGVHLVLAWQTALRQGQSRFEAVVTSVRRNAAPITLSVATSSASFVCLNLASSPPFRQLGNVVALGLLFTLVLCLTLLPALLLSIPGSVAPHRRRFESALARFGAWAASHASVLATLCAIVTAGSLYGVSRLDYDDRFTHYFDERYEIRRATDLFEEKLTGTTILAISVPAASTDSATTATHLGQIDAFSAWLGAEPGVRRVVTQTTPRAQDFAIRMVDAESRHSRVEVVLSDRTSAETLAFAARIKAEAAQRFGDDTIVTGIPILTAKMSLESARTMLMATALALIAVSGMLIVSVGSLRLGLVSLVPNVLPVLVAFGLWGALVGDVSFAATVVAALTFGIVVDDTVHILLRYRYARRAGEDPRQAVASSFSSVGLAVLVTTIVIGAGFSIYATSGFLVNQHFSVLATLTMVAALVADLVFLPPLLVLVDRDSGESATR